jgi:hypothetical protein
VPGIVDCVCAGSGVAMRLPILPSFVDFLIGHHAFHPRSIAPTLRTLGMDSLARIADSNADGAQATRRGVHEQERNWLLMVHGVCSGRRLKTAPRMPRGTALQPDNCRSFYRDPAQGDQLRQSSSEHILDERIEEPTRPGTPARWPRSSTRHRSV